MRLVRHPDRRQFAGAQQLGEREGVSSVRLYPIARALRNERRRDHGAVVPHRGQLAIQPIPGRSGLVAEVKSPVSILEPRHHPTYRRRIAIDLAEIPDLARSSLACDRHCVPGLRNVQPDENFAILIHGSSPALRIGSPCASNPRWRSMRRATPVQDGHAVLRQKDGSSLRGSPSSKPAKMDRSRHLIAKCITTGRARPCFPSARHGAQCFSCGSFAFCPM